MTAPREPHTQPGPFSRYLTWTVCQRCPSAKAPNSPDYSWTCLCIWKHNVWKFPLHWELGTPCWNDLGRCTVTFSLTKRAQGGKVGFDSWKRRHAADFHKLFSSCYLIWWMLKGSWAKTNYTPQNLRGQESKLKQRNFGKPLMDRQAFWLVYESANMKEEETWTLIITIYKRNFV